MVRTIFFLLLLLVFIKQSKTDDIRSFQVTLMNGWKFQCANTTCLPFTTIIVPDIQMCRITCLSDIHCKAASFHTLSTNCQLFADVSKQNENMLADINTITMILIDGTRIPAG
ncbi:unnamed protein product [Adineta steineri]|uniref:Apple domain-containing protein n=1 Tax=Adineta steineri TaxID=433720 RepID=A0A814V7H9_9BILA|nr:unnamed protein product [Adineta steineri]